MANYIPITRTNYFHITPGTEDAFIQWAEQYGGTVWRDTEGRYALSGDNEAAWTRAASVDEDADPDEQIHAADEVATYLAPNEVAVFMEVGYEKLRYLYGQAIAVHADGRQVHVNLHDVYAKARDVFGTDAHMTEATY